MKLLFKMFVVSIVQAMMIFSLTLAPIPFWEKVNVVYAADDDDEDACKEEESLREDGSVGQRVYRPGCGLDDALLEAQNENPGDDTVGIIEQYIAAAFGLAAISSITFIQHPLAQMDCPGYMTPDITLRIMQAGTLAYIIGHVQSNSQFKDAAKQAVDANLTPQAKKNEQVDDEEQAAENEQFNNDQLDAYIALIQIYEAKVDALQTKQDLSMVAEIGFLTALGFEIGMTSSHNAQCSIGDATDTTTETSINSAAARAGAAAAAYSGPEPTTQAACKKATGAASIKVSSEQAIEASNLAQKSAELVEIVEEADQDLGFMEKILGSFASIFTLGIANFFAGPPALLEAKEALRTAKAAFNESTRATNLFTSETTSATLTFDCTGCPVCADAAAAVVGAEIIKLKPLTCCGTRSVSTSNGFTAHSPIPGKIWVELDVIIPPVVFGGMNKDLEFIKKVASGFLLEYNLKQIEKMDIEQKQKLLKYKVALEEVDYFEHNFYSIIQSPEFKSELLRLKKIFNSSDNIDYHEILAGIKSEFNSNAYAGGFSEFMGLGIKMVGLQFAMGSFMRNTALTSPKNRAWTYGIMSVVNAALIKFNGDAKGEAERRLGIVEEEARVFAYSRPELTKKLKTRGSGKLNNLTKADMSRGETSGQQIVGCADPKGGNFVPAMCPSRLRRGNMNLPLNQDTKRRFGNSPIGQALPLLSDISYQAASGQGMQDPKTLNGRIGEISNIRNAVKKQAEKMLKDYENGYEKQLREISGMKSKPISKAMAQFRKQYQGNPATTGVSKQQLASLENSLAGFKVPEFEKLQSDKKKVAANKTQFSTPKTNLPNAGDFNFDMGGNDTTADFGGANGAGTAGGEENLNSFQVNAGEINERKDVSIFKIISNRYLRNYPVLLEEENP